MQSFFPEQSAVFETGQKGQWGTSLKVPLDMVYILMAYIVMTYIFMAHTFMVYILIAYTVTAYVFMAYIVMAYVVMTYVVMAYIVMAFKGLSALQPQTDEPPLRFYVNNFSAHADGERRGLDRIGG